MKLNSLNKIASVVGRWVITTLFCVTVMVGAWQNSLVSNPNAIAGPAGDVITASDISGGVKDKAGDVERGSKNLIENTKDKVKDMANRNANRVDAADDSGSFVEGKAKRDRDRIERRAEEDAARTERAVDASKNAVERATDAIKDAFN
jgi:uncharacterized protein YjbJ (UPF0337 family)